MCFCLLGITWISIFYLQQVQLVKTQHYHYYRRKTFNHSILYVYIQIMHAIALFFLCLFYNITLTKHKFYTNYLFSCVLL
ncbi:hypothetical protein V8B55DRAFT_1551081 [Mucor lusitanicus]